MEKQFKTVKEMEEQIKFCKFKDELGHPIENNIAFIELLEQAWKYEECSK